MGEEEAEVEVNAGRGGGRDPKRWKVKIINCRNEITFAGMFGVTSNCSRLAQLHACQNQQSHT